MKNQKYLAYSQQVDAIVSKCINYEQTAKESIRKHDGRVYIPLNLSPRDINPENLFRVLNELTDEALIGDSKVIDSRVIGNRIVCYPTENDVFVRGRAADRTFHECALVVDSISRRVIDVVASNGKSLVPEERFARDVYAPKSLEMSLS